MIGRAPAIGGTTPAPGYKSKRQSRQNRRAGPLRVLPGEYAVCRLPPDSPVPDMAHGAGLVATTRTDEELSVVCRSSMAPATARVEQPWRCLCVIGPLDLSMVGVLSALAEVLARLASRSLSSQRTTLTICSCEPLTYARRSKDCRPQAILFGPNHLGVALLAVRPPLRQQVRTRACASR